MINYPNKKIVITKKSNKAHLGMTLETDIDETNKYYLQKGIAVIHKKPTPVKIVGVSYPARNKARITEAYYVVPSTTDYNGIYLGMYIDFDVKETANKTNIPLANIKKHQIEHLKQINNHGGIGFLIIHFKVHNKYFILFIEQLLEFLDKNLMKSIPYQYFLDHCEQIKYSLNPRLDYLKSVEKKIKKSVIDI